MAKPKTDIIVQINLGNIHVYCDDAESQLPEVLEIEGVTEAILRSRGTMITVYVDPRYDLAEVAAEIEQLLTAKVPGAFRE